MTQQILNGQEIVTELDISHLTIEDDTPVDNFQSEKQQRLLVEPLYSSWSPDVSFIAAANVGVFYALKQDSIVPDALLSLNVQMPTDWSQKQNRSYFVWEFGKVPEVCVEIVSNRKGNELDSKQGRLRPDWGCLLCRFRSLAAASARRRVKWQLTKDLGTYSRAVCGDVRTLLAANGRTGFNPLEWRV
jgi:hypothetical protein